MADRTEQPAGENRHRAASSPEHIRGRYTPDVSIPTVSSEMIDNWPGTQGGNGGDQQTQTTEAPAGNQQTEKK